MRKIWKYELERKVFKIQSLFIPLPAKIVHVEIREGVILLWVDQNTAHAIVRGRNFFVVGTRDRVPDDAIYVGTVIEDSIYVWHIFEGDKSE